MQSLSRIEKVVILENRCNCPKSLNSTLVSMEEYSVILVRLPVR